MTEELSGVVQVPHRCPVKLSEVVQTIGLLSLRLNVTHGVSLGDFLLAPAFDQLSLPRFV